MDRKKKQSFVTLNSKIPLSPTQFFVLREVKGPPEEPTELVVELDNGEKVSVSKDKPYARVEGYEADLKYTVDNKAYNNLRLNATVHFAGEDYNIVAINQSEVVLSAKLNDKKYTIRLVGAQ